MENESKRLFELTDDELVDKIINKLAKVLPLIQNKQDLFVPEDEARRILNCGKTTLYHLRMQGKISYVQDDEHRKMIQYKYSSLINYLESNLKKAF